MAAEASGMCLLGAMDSLWFHHIILLSQKSLFLFPDTSKTILPSLKTTSQMSATSDHEISPLATVTACSQVESGSKESDDHIKETTAHDKRPARLNHVSNKTRSHSSSPISAKKQSRNLGNADYSARRLKKAMSLGDLELEEVKGFMDLGFSFKKENLSKRMMSLIPGLQRIVAHKTKEEQDSWANVEDEKDEENKGKMRPYLSEAWLIKKPDSPLLSLRIPRFCTASDMKKYLKRWAQTVALAIEQESC